ncbi:MAG: hypothetical protein SPJ23_01765 [Eubacteriales bacterium]|nr:hypothetical protein [Eubacteriales bacterium]
MQLDKNAISSLLSADDERLWQFVRTLAAASGVTLPEKISAEDMQRLRDGVRIAANSGITGENVAEALKRYSGGK